MISRIVATAFILAGALANSDVVFAHDVAKRYPHVGRFRYNGAAYIEAYFTWHRPGGWTVAEPGFELDFDLQRGFFESCTSWSDLPDFYDDCVTAGVSENDPERMSFGVGTYSALFIERNREYMAIWGFGTGSLHETDFAVTWQEVKKRWGFPKDPWYMIGTGDNSSGILVDRANKLAKNASHQRRWSATSATAVAGEWKQEPEGTYYYSDAGQHVAELLGPSGADFDLYLFKWNGSSWIRVAASATYSTNERVAYSGTAGYYTWNVHAYSGSGAYQVFIDYPSPPGAAP